MNNKQIAKHALNFIGGIPTVNCYNNDDQSKQIDIMCCKESKYSDTNSYASIGLNDFDGGVISENLSVRIELIGVAPANSDYMGNVVASAAFEIIDNGSFAYGDVIQNVVSAYCPDTDLKHVVLVSPVYWNEYTPFVEGDISVSWLMMIPVTTDEMQYIENYGIDAFEKLMVEKQIDILDLHRPSVI